MRNLFFICIIFSLINWSAVLPININLKEQFLEAETSVVRRECEEFKRFVGSNLFDGSRKNCFSPEDVNLLVARREFEIMIPKVLPPDLLNDESVRHILRYFYYGFWLFRRLEDCNTRRIMEKAFYDTLGGFLRYYLVPVCKFSFYASKVELKTVRNVMMLYSKCRVFLNTNGNGWRTPMTNPLTELKLVKIEPIKVTGQETFDEDDKCCSDLDLTTAPNNNMDVADDDMIIALPKIELEDSDGFLSNIWIPFSRKRTYNLRSCKSAFILLKFYRSVSRCYKKKSLPQKCFDRKFRQWIVENVKMHLGDDRFYPGLGGILNIYENTLVGEPADKAESKVDEDDDENSALIEDSLDENERYDNIRKRDLSSTFFDEELLDSEAPKTYGDKNLDDWLKTYNEIDPVEDAPKRIRRMKHLKCKLKCKKKKNAKMFPLPKCKPSNEFIVWTTKKPLPKCKPSTMKTVLPDEIEIETTEQPVISTTKKMLMNDFALEAKKLLEKCKNITEKIQTGEQKVDATEKPIISTTEETMESTEGSVEPTEESVETTEESIETTEESAETTEESVETTQKSVETTEESAETTEESAETTEEPAETTKESVETTEESVETTEGTVDKTEETAETTEETVKTTMKTTTSTTESTTKAVTSQPKVQSTTKSTYYVKKDRTPMCLLFGIVELLVVILLIPLFFVLWTKCHGFDGIKAFFMKFKGETQDSPAPKSGKPEKGGKKGEKDEKGSKKSEKESKKAGKESKKPEKESKKTEKESKKEGKKDKTGKESKKEEKASKKEEKAKKDDKKDIKKGEKDAKKAEKESKKDAKKEEKEKKETKKDTKKSEKPADKAAKKDAKKAEKESKKDAKKETEKSGKKDAKKAEKEANKAEKKAKKPEKEKKVKEKKPKSSASDSTPSKPRQPAGYGAKTFKMNPKGRTRQRRRNKLSSGRSSESRLQYRSRSPSQT